MPSKHPMMTHLTTLRRCYEKATRVLQQALADEDSKIRIRAAELIFKKLKPDILWQDFTQLLSERSPGKRNGLSAAEQAAIDNMSDEQLLAEIQKLAGFKPGDLEDWLGGPIHLPSDDDDDEGQQGTSHFEVA